MKDKRKRKQEKGGGKRKDLDHGSNAYKSVTDEQPVMEECAKDLKQYLTKEEI